MTKWFKRCSITEPPSLFGSGRVVIEDEDITRTLTSKFGKASTGSERGDNRVIDRELLPIALLRANDGEKVDGPGYKNWCS